MMSFLEFLQNFGEAFTTFVRTFPRRLIELYTRPKEMYEWILLCLLTIFWLALMVPLSALGWK